MQVKIQRVITALPQGSQSEVDDLCLHIPGRILDRTNFEYGIGGKLARQVGVSFPLTGRVTGLLTVRELVGDASRVPTASLVRGGETSPALTTLFSKLQDASPTSAGTLPGSGDASPAEPASFSRPGGASPRTGDALPTAEKASSRGGETPPATETEPPQLFQYSPFPVARTSAYAPSPLGRSESSFYPARPALPMG